MCEINWNTIGTCVGAAGTCITGLAMAYFAYKQNKINQGLSSYNIIRTYQEHFVKLQVVMYDWIRLDRRELCKWLMPHPDNIMNHPFYSQVFFQFCSLYEESQLFEAKTIKNVMKQIETNIYKYHRNAQEFVRHAQLLNDDPNNVTTRQSYDDHGDKLMEASKTFEELHQQVVDVYVSEIHKLRKA